MIMKSGGNQDHGNINKKNRENSTIKSKVKKRVMLLTKPWIDLVEVGEVERQHSNSDSNVEHICL